MNKSELKDLMVKITVNRDEIAFSNLFDFLAPKIKAYYLQNGLISENAEELTQEVMSIIWSKSDKFDPSKSALTTWVYTIARNKKIDFLRKNSKIKYNDDDIREFLYEKNETDKIEENEIENRVSKINSQLDINQQKNNKNELLRIKVIKK